MLGDHVVDLLVWRTELGTGAWAASASTSGEVTAVFAPLFGTARPEVRNNGESADALLNEIARDELPFARIGVSIDATITLETDILGVEGIFHAKTDTSHIFSNEGLGVEANVGDCDWRWREPIPAGRSTIRVDDLTPRQELSARQRIGSISSVPSSTSAAVISLRRQVIERIETLGKHARRLVISLSGGIDSAVIAAAAASSAVAERCTLIHVAVAGEREWEAELARATARTMRMPLVEVRLEAAAYLTEQMLGLDVGRHCWFGWALEWQRTVAATGDVHLTGRSGEWFGQDRLRLGLGVVCKRPSVLLDHHHAFTARSVLRSLMKETPTLAPLDLPSMSRAGAAHLLANPLVGPSIPTVCPFETLDMLKLASGLVGTGVRSEKLLLRMAYGDILPRQVVRTPRHGTPTRAGWSIECDGERVDNPRRLIEVARRITGERLRRGRS